MKYTKKPVTIDAISVREVVNGFKSNPKALPKWVQDAYENGAIIVVTDTGFKIDTLEGVMEASYADMLIKGVKGELYPCRADIFEATYEEAEQ